MKTYQLNTAAVENMSIPLEDSVCITNAGFGSEEPEPSSSTMPALGTKEFERLSRGLDTRSMGYRFIKRAFDIVMSICVLAVLVVAWPITLGLLIVITVQTKGFPIYIQRRVGQYGKTIRVPKLKTMVADSENVEKYLNSKQLEEWRKERKVTNDPRVVPCGAFLRRTSLDELGNFASVLMGGMSTIGPRPIVVEETKWYGSDLAKLLSVPQGITGWWQCNARNEASFESGKRQQLELEYIANASVSFDTKIFFKTFGVMFGSNRTGQ